MDNTRIMDVFQPVGNTPDLASKWKISNSQWNAGRQTTNQLQPVSSDVVVEILSEPKITSSIEDERQWVVWCESYPNKRDNVWMGELTTRQDFPEVSLYRI